MIPLLKDYLLPTITTAQPVEQKVEETIEIVSESSTLADIVNSENERIVTTVDEQELSRIVTELFPEVELVVKDTESYFSVLFQNKNNRWLFRYDVNRKRPTIQFAVAIDDYRKKELAGRIGSAK